VVGQIIAQQVVITVPPVCTATWNYHYIDLLNSTKSNLISLRATQNPKIIIAIATQITNTMYFVQQNQYIFELRVLYYSIMVTTRAGHAKKRAVELVASTRQYQHPPSYDHDVDNIGLLFEELKQCHIKQALRQCQDRNGPLAKAMIDMIENPPPPFESSDDETTNNVLIRKHKRKGNRGKSAK
jgi:hypothetical protein